MSDSFFQLIQKKAAAVACASLLSLMTVFVVVHNIQFWLAHTGGTVDTHVTQPTERHSNLVTQIPTWHLFGLAPVAHAHLANTNLALRLRGVLVSSRAPLSTAIIKPQSQREKVYKTGDILPGGAVLYRVDNDAVILKNQGRLERLPLVQRTLE